MSNRQGPAERSRGIPKHLWTTHKPMIQDLYMNQRMKLKDVMETMRARGFNTSEQQYKIKFHEWAFTKNKRKGDGTRDIEVQPSSVVADSQYDPTTLSSIPTIGAPVGNLDPPTSQAIWAQPSMNSSLGGFDTLDSQMDFDQVENGFIMLNDSNSFQPFNLGIPQGQGVQASPSWPRTAGAKVRQPIHQATQSGNIGMVRVLLAADPRCAGLPGTEGETPIWIAAQQGHLEVVKLLLSCEVVNVNAMTTSSLRSPLHQAAQGGHTEIVQLLLDHHAVSDTVDESNITPLWSAAQQGHNDVVKILIEKGCNKETASDNGNRRPIHQAAQNGHAEIVKLLVEQDPNDIHVEEGHHVTPLFLASQGDSPGHIEVVKYLIAKGAAVVMEDIKSSWQGQGQVASSACA